MPLRSLLLASAVGLAASLNVGGAASLRSAQPALASSQRVSVVMKAAAPKTEKELREEAIKAARAELAAAQAEREAALAEKEAALKTLKKSAPSLELPSIAHS